MEPSSIARIDDIVDVHEKWDTKELIFVIENKKLDVIPFLGEGLKSRQTLSFVNPNEIAQKELIVLLKQQSAAQGIHLTTVKSSINPNSATGRHFTLGCHRHRLYSFSNDFFDK